MGGGGGTQPRAPSATAVVDEELGGSERDGDGGGGGDGLVDGHGGRGTRAGGLRARMLPSIEVGRLLFEVEIQVEKIHVSSSRWKKA